ncbi:MAG: hypothetical protein ACJ786_08075 [Catenulispora sp.]
MSKSRASNPTRPAVGSAEVRQKLRNLAGAKRRRLEDWGYPVDQLAELAARDDAQADAVDALLAIILDRGGYTHDDADVAAAEKVAKKVDAKMTPYAYLVARHKAPERPSSNYQGYLKPGQKDTTVLGFLGIIGGVLLILVIIGVIVAFTR